MVEENLVKNDILLAIVCFITLSRELNLAVCIFRKIINYKLSIKYLMLIVYTIRRMNLMTKL